MRMYLSRYLISEEDCINNRIIDDYYIHQLVYALFPSENERRFLYFVKRESIRGREILIQSEVEPQMPKIGYIETKTICEEFFKAKEYAFKVRLVPVTRADGKVSRVLKRKEDVIDWLTSHESDIGVAFIRDTLERCGSGCISMEKNRDLKPIVFFYSDIKGVFIVKDYDKFLSSVVKGIGRSRGFGFGMLQLDIFK